MLLVYLLVLVASFYVLARIVDLFFLESLEAISKRLKLSSDVAGATFMAMGSSAPEFFIAFFALFRVTQDQQAIGAGTIVGSAIFNILVIIGASALFKRSVLTWQPVLRDLLFYILTILVLLFTFMDGRVTLGDSLIFILMYVAYIFSFKPWKKLFPYTTKGDIDKEIIEDIETEQRDVNRMAWGVKSFVDKTLSLVFFDLQKREKMYPLNFLISIGLLALVSHVMVESAVLFAHGIGIPEVIIGLTILAAGTSIPDLISSVIVAKKGKGDMAVANAVGSNIFDINIGLGLPWLIFILWKSKEVVVATENLQSSIFLLFATVVALLFLLISKRWEVTRYAGVLLIASYVVYLLIQIGFLDVTFCVNLSGHHCIII